MAQTYRYPAGASVSISAIGTNGAANPATSIQIGGKSPSNTLLPIAVDASGNLIVSLLSNAFNLAQVGGVAISLGQKAMAASLPVVLSSDQSALAITAASLPLPAGAATSALQTSGNASLSSIDTSSAAINTKTPALGQALAAASVPVVLTAAQLSTLTPLATVAATQSGTWNINNIAGTISLPTGAATEATLAAASAKLPAALGQTTMAASLAVTIASNQTAIPVTTTVTDVTASGTITTQNLAPTGAATAGSALASGALNGAGTAAVQVTGTYTGALSLQYTVDGTNWITVGGTPFLNVNTGAYSATIASAAQGIYQIEATGMPQYRITALAAVTGTATVSLRTSRATNMVTLDNSIPAGTNIIGALSANQSANVAQINGVAPLMGNGVTGTGSQRVTIASDNTAFTVNAAQSGAWQVRTNDGAGVSIGSNTVGTLVGLNVSQISRTASTRSRIDYSSTPVTTGAYTQLVASTAAIIREVEIFDSSGQTLILAVGAAASEVDQIYIFPGGNGRIPLYIAGGQRVSIKAVSATANVGESTINFYA